MKLKEAVARFGRNIEAFAGALAYDEREDIEARLSRLEADGQSHQERLQSLSEQVQAQSVVLRDSGGKASPNLI
jgi:ABC-type phosphate transport system auxiliary subunit